MSIQSLPALLKARAEENADAPFLYSKDQVWSFRELDQTSDVVARELRLSRIEEGDRVALVLPNGPEFVLAFFGILKLGAIAVPINDQFNETEIASILRDCGASAALLGKAHHPIAESLLSECSGLKFTQKVERGETKQEVLRLLSPFETKKELHFPLLEPDQAAAIIYSPEATRFPKGAVLSHGNYVSECEKLAQAVNLTSEDRFLCFLPLFQVEVHTTALLCAFFSGASVVLIDKFEPKDFFKLAAKHQCTALTATPSIYSVLSNLTEDQRRGQFSLKICLCQGAMPAAALKRFDKKYKTSILEGFGLPETTGFLAVNPAAPKARKIGSIGIPIEAGSVKILGQGGRDLPARETGEILLRGENIMQGYWENDDATAGAIKDGWLYTGEMGYLDEDGYCFRVGAKKK